MPADPGRHFPDFIVQLSLRTRDRRQAVPRARWVGALAVHIEEFERRLTGCSCCFRSMSLMSPRINLLILPSIMIFLTILGTWSGLNSIRNRLLLRSGWQDVVII